MRAELRRIPRALRALTTSREKCNLVSDQPAFSAARPLVLGSVFALGFTFCGVGRFARVVPLCGSGSGTAGQSHEASPRRRLGSARERRRDPARFGACLAQRRYERGPLGELDERLRQDAVRIAKSHPGAVLGFYSRYGKRFLGSSARAEEKTAKDEIVLSRRPAGGPPVNDFELIEMRVHASIRKKTALYASVESPPNLLAVFTRPVRRNDEVVGAVWAIRRIDDSGPLNSATKGYLVYASCSLAGNRAFAGPFGGSGFHRACAGRRKGEA